MSIKIKSSQKKGFTIVETLIVLAVTGSLFLSTSLLIRGQTEKYRYRDSMIILQQTVQNSIGDVQNGNISAGVSSVTGCTGSDGTSSDCVIAGKKITFCNGTTCPKTQIKKETIIAKVLAGSATNPCTSITGVPTIGGPGTCALVQAELVDNPYSLEFTGPEKSFTVMFTDYSGAHSQNNYQSIVMKNSAGNSTQALESVCVSGYQKGSISFGGALGMQIEMKPQDTVAC